MCQDFCASLFWDLSLSSTDGTIWSYRLTSVFELYELSKNTHSLERRLGETVMSRELCLLERYLTVELFLDYYTI